MPFSQTVYVALCFNSEAEALALSEGLKDLAPKIEFITASSFDGFLKAIAAVEKIDCFIIEEDYKECSSYDLIEKLKQGHLEAIEALKASNKSLTDEITKQVADVSKLKKEKELACSRFLHQIYLMLRMLKHRLELQNRSCPLKLQCL